MEKEKNIYEYMNKVSLDTVKDLPQIFLCDELRFNMVADKRRETIIKGLIPNTFFRIKIEKCSVETIDDIVEIKLLDEVSIYHRQKDVELDSREYPHTIRVLNYATYLYGFPYKEETLPF